MAKKRKREREVEGYEFKMPEFDEKEFIKKEVRESKVLFVTIGYGALMGILSFGLTFVDIALAALVGFIAIVFLRHIYPRLGVDTSLLEKKTWAGNIVMYLFTWLAIWILLVNPPFSDFGEPTIKDVEIYFGSPGNWTRLNESNNISIGTNASINATIKDNVDVQEDTIEITIRLNEVDIVENQPMVSLGKHKYAYVLNNVGQGMHEYTIIAKDINGHEAKYSGSFPVGF